jgi:hypothetical protein
MIGRYRILKNKVTPFFGKVGKIKILLHSFEKRIAVYF